MGPEAARAQKEEDRGADKSTSAEWENLDPSDWEEFRAFLHRVCDEMTQAMQSYGSQPWKPAPSEVKARFTASMPIHALGIDSAYQEFKHFVLPYGAGNTHPRFWGWVLGGGTPTGAVGEFLAAVMNTSVSNFDQIPALIELQVIECMREMIGFPAEASGVLVSGCSEANLLGLVIARNTIAPFNVRQEGLTGAHPRLTLYASKQTHASIHRAAEIIGIGREGLRLVNVNRDWSVNTDDLQALVKEDRSLGRIPFCVVGNAGTVNTGAIDDLKILAEFSRREGLWFHVDGALGAVARLSSELRDLVDGIEDADSVSLDFHKLLGQPFDVGCLMTRSKANHKNSFAFDAEYFTRIAGSISDGETNFAELGIQTTRSFRALKIWLSLKSEGLAKFGRQVEKSVSLARYFAQKIDEHEHLEQMSPVSFNIVVFRFVAPDLAEDQIAMVNLSLLLELQREGLAVVSSTILEGRFCLRAAIANHRTTVEDIDFFIKEIMLRGKRLCVDYAIGQPNRTSPP